MVQTKVIDLIEMHILCLTNFYDDNIFAENHGQSLEVVTGWGTVAAVLSVF